MRQTRMSDYANAVTLASGNKTITTPYVIGAMTALTADINLAEAGYQTSKNEIVLTMRAVGSENDTFSVNIYGTSLGGGAELIGTVNCVLGTAATGVTDEYWVDTMTVTNHHIASDSFVSSDSGNNRICKLGFDAVGYRFITFGVTNTSSVTGLKIDWRAI